MKKILCLILTLIIVSALFVSCSDDVKKEKKTRNTAQTETVQSTESKDDSDAAMVDDYVQGLTAGHDYAGESFTFTGREGPNFPTAEEETGELVSDAVYHRQRDLEEIFGIDFVNIPDASGDVTQEKVISDVMSGGGEYDLVYGSMIIVAQRLIAANVIVDFYENVPDVDLSQQWWMQNLSDCYEINGKLYFIDGEAVTDYFDISRCMIFSKQLQTDFNIPDMYRIVRDGEWTIDKMTEIASVVPTTDDDNGIFRYGADTSYSLPWIFASGITITKYDDNGTPYIDTVLDPKLSDLCDKLCVFLADDTQSLNVKNMGNYKETFDTKYHAYSSLQKYFEDNKVLFWFASTREASGFRATDVEFGILPLPKYDTAQQNYCSYAEQSNGGAFFVLKTAKSFEKSGVITEAMGALSHKYIKPAYYEKILKGRTTYDFESREMIDLVFNTTVYDLLDVFSMGDMNRRGEFTEMFDKAIYADSSSLASDYATIAKVTAKMMNRTISKLDK